MSTETKEEKPELPSKSSMEILSELFSTFHAKPPLIIKKEKSDDSSRKHKKKKKHKHKDKKHKKKEKRRKRSSGSSSEDSDESVDLAKILIKNEKEIAEKKIKLELKQEKVEETKDTRQEKEESINGNHKTDDGDHKTIDDDKKRKIIFKDLRQSSIFESTKQETHSKLNDHEEGEASESDDSSRHRRKKHKSHSKRRSRSKSRESHKKVKTEDSESKKIDTKHSSEKSRYKEESRDRSKHRNVSRERDKHRDRSRDRTDKGRDRSSYIARDTRRDKRSYEREGSSRDRHRRHGSRDRDRDEYSRELEEYKRNRSRIKDDGFYKSREKTSQERDDKWFMRDRYRGYTDRNRHDKESTSKIDKKKLLEIARKNAITMMKSGSLPAALTLGPQAQEKVIAAIKSGGKTIDELTDFCKTLSKKEELGELSSLSEKEDSDSDADKPFHHPFQLKDRPTSITMNIKNSVPLPIKTNVERTGELRMQFPVSSGQQHRKGEEWQPVSPPPQKTEDKTPLPVPPPTNTIPLPIEAPPLPLTAPLPPAAPPVPAVPQVVTVPAPLNAPPGPQMFPTPINEPTVDIGSIVSQRLTAMRRLQENPNDVQALTQMYKSNKEMQSWATSKQQLGQFTGSTGAQILSQAELSSGYQAWAKKDQLQTAAPVSGGMGMHLLQKMGWRPGEGLGKEKTGALEPLLLEVKLDKKGLVANEEQRGKKKVKVAVPTVKTLQGKHPVSLLGEYASKRKLGAPQYILEFECGPDHKKNFLFKVILNGVEYKPNVASNNKKEAKAAAASVCLQQIGLLPS